MNAKISVFVICVEAIIYFSLCNLYDLPLIHLYAKLQLSLSPLKVLKYSEVLLLISSQLIMLYGLADKSCDVQCIELIKSRSKPGKKRIFHRES